MFGNNRDRKFEKDLYHMERNAKHYLGAKANNLEKENEKLKARLTDAFQKNKKLVELYTEVFNSNKLYQKQVALQKKIQKNYEKEIEILKSKIKQLNLTLLNMPMKQTMTHITKFDKDTSPVKVPTTKPQRISYKRTF